MKTTIDLSSPKLLNSLIFLTDEPDEHLYISIANEILAYGTAALPFLKEKIKSISNVFHEERLNNLIYSIVLLYDWLFLHSVRIKQSYKVV